MSATVDTPGRKILRSWLNKTMRIKMTDGRVLIGAFMCTDRDRNVILGSCQEYLKEDSQEEPRVLGLAMVPGHHIVSIDVDQSQNDDLSCDKSMSESMIE
ncbi:N-alpha-acetyltransferase 38, NatC auxiliary subunit-like [Tubulanus polymorphus]|uniref:N-alpha-acetyltransferase 38, NatC auxiliary subunit-like n=1 Tax=Tubulanus polymorphus TaxID=672921 RepID=UPI003DA42861